MEPRPDDRGDGASSARSARACRGLTTAETKWVAVAVLPVHAGLQWSRGLTTAETDVTAANRAEFTLLQWSRGLTTAETRTALEGRANSKDELQWSRGLTTAETGIVLVARLGELERFNGAAA